MKVLVIGANGQVGKHIVEKLKGTEHEPVAMVRDTNQIPQFEEQGVKTVLGDLEGDFESAFYGIDSVIFAAGSGPNTGADKTILIDQEGAIKAMHLSTFYGVRRFMMLSSVGADRPHLGTDDMKHYLYAKHRADEHLKSTDLNYTIVRPGILTNDAGNGKVEIAEHLSEIGEIPREDVAHSIVHLLDVPAVEYKSYDLVSGEQKIDQLFRT
ncbi:SDR family oxidoreductase [Thalassobacillus hwangdonensis]|uniref:SDR family oxidoreductase n=1 Tax=Thalassobacillus hwangdonensis TaxID=546108 RepID=A0ABW3L065_9BACI